MRIRLKFLSQAAVGVVVVGVLGGCSTSGRAVRNDSLLGSRNLIPPPYARPSAGGAPSSLIPSSSSVPALPAEPMLPESEPAGFVPAEVSVPVVAPHPESVVMPPLPKKEVVSRPLPKAGSETYVVRKSDTLSGIAKSHGVNWQDIAALNPSVDPDRIKVGDKLVMPDGAHLVKPVAVKASAVPKLEGKPAAAAKKSVVASSAKSTAAAVLPADGVYTVVSGDNLSKIASHYKVKISDIRSWNTLQSDNLSIGQKLKLRGDATVSTATTKSDPAAAAALAPAAAGAAVAPVAAAAATAVPAEPLAAAGEAAAPVAAEAAAPVEGDVPANSQFLPVMVTEGDTLEKMAGTYLTTVEDILKNNPQIKTNADLKPGMTLRMSYNINQLP